MKCLNAFVAFALLLRSCRHHRHIFLRRVESTKANNYLEENSNHKYISVPLQRKVKNAENVSCFFQREREREEKSSSRRRDGKQSWCNTLNTNRVKEGEGGEEKRRAKKTRLRMKEETADLHEMWLWFLQGTAKDDTSAFEAGLYLFIYFPLQM